jgi:methionine-R-sulfoxide reductase
MADYKKPTANELKTKLTPQQYSCTQEAGTETPFKNAYWDNKEDGIYVDVVSNEPLFSSLDKYDSGSGWPSFTKPLEKTQLKTNSDFHIAMNVKRFAQVRRIHIWDMSLMMDLKRPVALDTVSIRLHSNLFQLPN